MRITGVEAQTSVGDYGQQVEQILVTVDEPVEEQNISAHFTNAFTDFTGKVPVPDTAVEISGSQDATQKDTVETDDVLMLGKRDFTEVETEQPFTRASGSQSGREACRNVIRIIPTPFPFKFDFSLDLSIGDSSFLIRKNDLTRVEIKGVDAFGQYDDPDTGVRYRLYSPGLPGKRPLILFLHGGGEFGTDNQAQLTGTLGAIQLSSRFSDMYVLAPQGPVGDDSRSFEEQLRAMRERGNPFRNNMGDTPFSLKGERGWNRHYLAGICSVIREMIMNGQVDPERVYVIGMSAGGGGTLTICSVDHGLFASAVAICPSMNGEAYSILQSFPKIPLWIAAAYADHQRSRTSYLLEACEKLWKEGRSDVRYSIFTEEELAKYGLGVTPGLSVEELLEENHNVWIPVLHNERGIMDWMVSVQKESLE